MLQGNRENRDKVPVKLYHWRENRLVCMRVSKKRRGGTVGEVTDDENWQKYK